MKKISTIFFTIGFILTISAKETEYIEVSLINFADIYNLEASKYGSGLLSLKKILNAQRSYEKHLFICCSGDVLLTNGPEKSEKGQPIVNFLNECDIDIVSFGNHEFAFGLEALEKRISVSNFKWLGSNVRKVIRDGHGHTKMEKLAYTHNYLIYKLDQVKIGFFSICLPETNKLYKKACNGKINFCDITTTAKRYINKLKYHNVDIIVALTHLNLREDIMLSKKFPEINVILGAHDHKNISFFNGNTLIHKAGSDAGFIGKVTIKLNKMNHNLQLNWRTINNNFNCKKQQYGAVY